MYAYSAQMLRMKLWELCECISLQNFIQICTLSSVTLYPYMKGRSSYIDSLYFMWRDHEVRVRSTFDGACMSHQPGSADRVGTIASTCHIYFNFIKDVELKIIVCT